MAASPTLWPAAVSERSATMLRGPAQRATVLGAFRTVLYLQVGGHAEVLPVVARHGLRLPTALAVATTLPTVGWGAQPGDEVGVGHGEVRLPGLTIRAVRTWRPRRLPAAALTGPTCLEAVRLPWRDPARTLTEALLLDDARAAAGQVGALVGAGPGLTPSGDDILCGVMLGLRLHARGSSPVLDRLWQTVRPRLRTTTSLSASLLAEAAQGYAVEPVVRLAEALAAGGATDGPGVADAVAGVLAIGHSSGADLLGGLAGCLDALDALGALDALNPLDALNALGALDGSDLADHQGGSDLATTSRSLP